MAWSYRTTISCNIIPNTFSKHCITSYFCYQDNLVRTEKSRKTDCYTLKYYRSPTYIENAIFI